MTLNHLAVAAALCALLSACATTGGDSGGAASSAQPGAPYRDTIELSGRLSVNYDKDGKQESLTGKFAWRQNATRTDVSLDSPLGQTIAVISVTPQQATLTQAGKAPRTAPDIDTLSGQALGWALPVSGLRDWLQGVATGADGQRFEASPAHDSVTTRDGWRLHYVSWQDGGPYSRPKRIDAERSASATANAVAIRILIDAPAAP